MVPYLLPKIDMRRISTQEVYVYVWNYSSMDCEVALVWSRLLHFGPPQELVWRLSTGQQYILRFTL